MNQDIEKVSEFWDWFIGAVTETADCFEDRDFITALDSKLATLGDISWEIGPGIISPENNSLVLSPAGDEELLRLTTKFIESAPELIGWEFYPAKPPKNWQMRFTITDDHGNDVEIDASEWRYGMVKHDSGFDIVVQAPNIRHLPDDLQYAAVEIVLDGELGEEARMTRVNCIDIVKDIDSKLGQRHNPIDKLRDHFGQLSSRKQSK